MGPANHPAAVAAEGSFAWCGHLRGFAIRRATLRFADMIGFPIDIHTRVKRFLCV
jgi:hypothetical protein